MAAPVTVCATVSTGFESVAAGECKEKLGSTSVREGRGRIYFEIPVNSFPEIKTLRSVEHLFVVVKEFQGNNELLDCFSPEILEKFYKLPQELKWDLALSLWKQFTGYGGILFKRELPPDEVKFEALSAEHVVKKDCQDTRKDGVDWNVTENDNREAPAKRRKHNNEDCDKEEEFDCTLKKYIPSGSESLMLPRFRVTCTRTGKKHTFSSPEAAAKFGGGINDWFGWPVDLSNPDVEVLLNIVESNVVIGVALTKESRGKRNIAHFGPTTLKSSIAYCMLKLANIQTGEVICDPMCGGGSIPIEAVLNWPTCVHLCGDNHELAPPRTLANVRSAAGQEQNKWKTPPLDVYQWNVCNLPLKSNSVDVFISDLPFGKKSGSKHENWKLYPEALQEMARVCCAGSGRAVLLTQDKRVMGQVLNKTVQWKKDLTLWINMGGLKAGLYVLSRTKK
ncbi:tRNA (guanine(6)-N2)-methyltransferase THUMP3-like isoform X2 [Montipora capricornis]|uniref:tRNA (guanine(6)-N2)-methyltransferase THUMP3-like isoform X2 n=1 Tax=Montipora capricornis TaxID=246305 RepID=UPI0035F13407